MEENKKVEIDPMNMDDFKEYLANRGLRTFNAVNKFRSVSRAIKRGLVRFDGVAAPKRPFNNRANTSTRKGVHSRVFNEQKKVMYGRIKKYQLATD